MLPGQSADPTVLQLHTTNATHRQRYAASRKEVPSDDVLVAFGQSEPYIQEVVSSLTDAQRAGMMLCVADMVDEFVGRSVA